MRVRACFRRVPLVSVRRSVEPSDLQHLSSGRSCLQFVWPDFESACGGSIPPGAIQRALLVDVGVDDFLHAPGSVGDADGVPNLRRFPVASCSAFSVPSQLINLATYTGTNARYRRRRASLDASPARVEPATSAGATPPSSHSSTSRPGRRLTTSRRACTDWTTGSHAATTAT
jgi:hypothetical protein